MGNNILNKARASKKDEFYTQHKDIQDEVKHYEDFLAGKVVYCNCDDEWSNFWFYFVQNFERLGLKRVIATGIKGERLDYDGDTVFKKTIASGKFQDNTDILAQVDVVVTNPPFSLFREYMATLVDSGKQFLVLGNVNAISYKELFPLIRDRKIWVGYNSCKSLRFLTDCDSVERSVNICWFTNIHTDSETAPLPLTKEYTPEQYPFYDNYDAIEVSKVKNIPVDYYGVMGVPITFLSKWNYEQFDVLGVTDRSNNSGFKSKVYTKKDASNYHDLNRGGVIVIDGKYKTIYDRILIRHKKEVGNNGLYTS